MVKAIPVALALLGSVALLDNASLAGESTTLPAGSAQDQAVLRALDEKTTFDFHDIPLSDVAQYFTDKHNIRVVLDKRSLGDAGIGFDTPIVRRAKNVSLRAGLNLILRSHELTYLIDDGALLIISEDDESRKQSIAVYDVRDLLELGLGVTVPGKASPEDYDYRPLMDVITTHLVPRSWDSVDGPASISPVYGTLVATQSQRGNEVIARLLASIRTVHARRKPSAAGNVVDIKPVWIDRSLADDAIRSALDQTTSCDFNETPLADAMEFFNHKHGVQIILDKKSLDDEGIGSDTPISGQLDGISLRLALRQLLKQHDLTLLVRDEVVQVVTREAARFFLETAVYDIRDLLEMGRPVPIGLVEQSIEDEARVLIDTIVRTVAWTKWSKIGGAGEIDTIYGMLVVTQAAEAHEELARLLSLLRTVQASRKSLEAAAPVTKDAPPSVRRPASALTVRVYSVTLPPTTAAAIANMPTRPGTNGAEAGGATNRLVDISAQHLNQSKHLPHAEFIARVTATVMTVVEPDSWESKGGAGAISTMPIEPGGRVAIVVRQTAAIHGRIERLLTELRIKGALPGPNFCGSVRF